MDAFSLTTGNIAPGLEGVGGSHLFKALVVLTGRSLAVQSSPKESKGRQLFTLDWQVFGILFLPLFVCVCAF